MSHGMFFKQDTGPSTIELLLNDVDAAAAVQDSSSDAAAAVAAGVPPPHMPTVEDFLDEEGLSFCRGVGLHVPIVLFSTVFCLLCPRRGC